MKIVADEDKFIGAGQCALTAKQVFDQRDAGVVILLADTPPDPDQPAARDAAVLCPASAITVSED
jgi:ferredoxin